MWEVLRDARRDGDADRIRKAFPQLSRARITAAVIYDARYRDEVPAQIDANTVLTPEAIERQCFRRLL